QPETGGDQQARPDVRIGDLHPKQGRDDHRDQDEQPAHGRRAALGEVALRPVGADRLTLALGRAQPADEPGAAQQADEPSGGAGLDGAEADVADEIEDAGEAELVGDYVEHVARSPATRSTSLASPTELDAFTRTASPGWSLASSPAIASSTSS